MTSLAIENRRDNLSNKVIGHFGLLDSDNASHLMGNIIISYGDNIHALSSPSQTWQDSDPAFRGYNHEINHDTSTFGYITEIEDVIEEVEQPNQTEELTIPKEIHETRTRQIEITIVEVEKGLPSDVDDDDLLMYID